MELFNKLFDTLIAIKSNIIKANIILSVICLLCTVGLHLFIPEYDIIKASVMTFLKSFLWCSTFVIFLGFLSIAETEERHSLYLLMSIGFLMGSFVTMTKTMDIVIEYYKTNLPNSLITKDLLFYDKNFYIYTTGAIILGAIVLVVSNLGKGKTKLKGKTENISASE